MQKDGISQDDLAQLLGVSSRTLRVWRRERRGPGCEFNGLQPWYPLTKVIPWLKKHRPDIDLASSMARYVAPKPQIGSTRRNLASGMSSTGL